MSEYQSLFLKKNAAGRNATGSPSLMNQSHSTFTDLPYLYSLGIRRMKMFSAWVACLVVGLTATVARVRAAEKERAMFWNPADLLKAHPIN